MADTILNKLDKEALPKHIGIIMDGNGRWAKKRGLPRYAGHKKGATVFRSISKYCNKIGINYLTVYAFSTENWKRPKEEVDAIMKLMDGFLDDFKQYVKLNIKVRFIGDLSAFNESMYNKIRAVEDATKNATGLNLNIALNYGGRDDILAASKKLAQKVADGEMSIADIDEDVFSQNLYTFGQDDVDLVIRPSGEQRISNFLLWQTAYAEFVFMDVLWPDFTPKHLDEALIEFAKRTRRFGGV